MSLTHNSVNGNYLTLKNNNRGISSLVWTGISEVNKFFFISIIHNHVKLNQLNKSTLLAGIYDGCTSEHIIHIGTKYRNACHCVMSGIYLKYL